MAPRPLRSLLLVLSLGAAVVAPAAAAQVREPQGVVTVPGGADLELSAELRLRAERRDAVPPVAGAPDESVNSARLRLGFLTRFGDSLSAFAQVQGVVANQGFDSEVDLHQAWLDFADLGDVVDLRAGRMELDYGSGLMVSPYDWSPTGNAWDGLRARVGFGGAERPTWTLDAFWTRAVEGQAVPDGMPQTFGGVWVTVPRDPFDVDAYLLVRDQSDQPFGGLSDRTFGARLSDPDARLPWEVEAALQTGEHGALDAGGWLAHGRLAGPLGDDLVLGGTVLWASGDGDPLDGDDGAFVPLFPDVHRWLGPQDLFVPSNVLDLAVDLTWALDPRWDLVVEGHWMRLADEAGGIPTVDGSLTATGTDSGLGTIFAASLRGPLMDALDLEFGLATFAAGDAVANGDGQLWAYAQLVADV